MDVAKSTKTEISLMLIYRNVQAPVSQNNGSKRLDLNNIYS